MSQDRQGFSRVRDELLEAKEAAGISYDQIAQEVGPVDVDTLRYTFTRRRTMPPRAILEPAARAVGLSWDRILSLL